MTSGRTADRVNTVGAETRPGCAAGAEPNDFGAATTSPAAAVERTKSRRLILDELIRIPGRGLIALSAAAHCCATWSCVRSDGTASCTLSAYTRPRLARVP